MYDVISIGSAYLDIFVKSNQFKLVNNDQFASGVAMCEAYGAKIEVDDITLASGGGATNSAVSFARKGLKTSCISEMGKDLPAGMIINDLKNEQVDISMLVQEVSEKTAMSVVMVAPEGGRSIITYRGASGMLQENDIPWERLPTKWFYITSLGGHMDLLSKLMNYSKEFGIKMALNPGSKELKFNQQIRIIGKQADILSLNIEEAANYLEINVNNEKDILSGLKSEGGQITLLTLGPKGAYVVTKEKTWFCPPSENKPVETTGAGDAFGSGFVAGQIFGWDIEKSTQLAIVNASSVINYLGAKQGLLTLEQFNKLKLQEIKQLN